MDVESEILPDKVREYIDRHFGDDTNCEIKIVKKDAFQRHYILTVVDEEHIYHLRFNESGWLLRKAVEDVLTPTMGNNPH